jgi:hypothetical protein
MCASGSAVREQSSFTEASCCCGTTAVVSALHGAAYEGGGKLEEFSICRTYGQAGFMCPHD